MKHNLSSNLWHIIAFIFSFTAYHKIKERKTSKTRQLFSLLLSLSVIILITLFRENRLQNKQAILIPFKAFITIRTVGWFGHGRYLFRELLGNIVLFIPFGICLSRKEGAYYKYMVPFLVSLTIETIQYFTRLGTFEVDDLICNTIGGILGYELGKQISGQRKGRFIIPGIYLAALGVCCLKSILFN